MKVLQLGLEHMFEHPPFHFQHGQALKKQATLNRDKALGSQNHDSQSTKTNTELKLQLELRHQSCCSCLENYLMSSFTRRRRRCWRPPWTPSCSRSHSWPSSFPRWGLGHRTWALHVVGSALGNPIGCLHLVEQEVSSTPPPKRCPLS